MIIFVFRNCVIFSLFNLRLLFLNTNRVVVVVGDWRRESFSTGIQFYSSLRFHGWLLLPLLRLKDKDHQTIIDFRLLFSSSFSWLNISLSSPFEFRAL